MITKNHHIIILLFILDFGISQNAIVEETRFENFWRRTFKQMSFREPVSFMPYNLKIGYFTYGGDDYLDNWNNILIGDNGYEASPFTLNNSNFPDISPKKYRTSKSRQARGNR